MVIIYIPVRIIRDIRIKTVGAEPLQVLSKD